MRKNISFRAVCLIAAIAVLGGIAAYAAVAGSPYEILKNALLDALTYHNGTQEIDAVMTVNGEPYERSKQRTVNGDNGYLTYDYDENGEVSDYSYHADGLSVYP
ncbi:MAG: hypothetical protein LBT12_07145, partial [Oscillospiraceae bacterium]|nr:hypothetical protein [Oscillospiraceae bacterium]